MNLFLYLLTYLLLATGFVFMLLGILAQAEVLMIVGIVSLIAACLVDQFNKLDNSNYY